VSPDAKLAPDALEGAADAHTKLPKVQLDIDDAPFLREKPPDPPPPTPQAPVKSDAPLEAPPKPAEAQDPSKKKKIIIIALALLLLLLGGGGAGVWWFKFRIPPEPPPPPPKPQVIVVPTPQPDSGPAESLISLAPFWLELPSELPRSKDKIFFLVCKFTAIAKTEAVLKETQSKTSTIRDALYFYLHNKTIEFLTNPENTQLIKNDLISVINGYLTGNNKVDDVLFERYVTKGMP
jgi:flagellar FliL protein